MSFSRIFVEVLEYKVHFRNISMCIRTGFASLSQLFANVSFLSVVTVFSNWRFEKDRKRPRLTLSKLEIVIFFQLFSSNLGNLFAILSLVVS